MIDTLHQRLSSFVSVFVLIFNIITSTLQAFSFQLTFARYPLTPVSHFVKVQHPTLNRIRYARRNLLSRKRHTGKGSHHRFLLIVRQVQAQQLLQLLAILLFEQRQVTSRLLQEEVPHSHIAHIVPVGKINQELISLRCSIVWLFNLRPILLISTYQWAKSIPQCINILVHLLGIHLIVAYIFQQIHHTFWLQLTVVNLHLLHEWTLGKEFRQEPLLLNIVPLIQ